MTLRTMRTWDFVNGNLLGRACRHIDLDQHSRPSECGDDEKCAGRLGGARVRLGAAFAGVEEISDVRRLGAVLRRLLASNGPAQDCAVDKIEQFQVELAAPGTDAEERLFALKFILHFVGDLHQPLHSSDNHDRGGNEVKVTVVGFPHKSKDELHGFWDTQFVDGVATPPAALAKKLLGQIKPSDASTWATASPEDWQKEAFAIAKGDAYDLPPMSPDKTEHLSASYVTKAEKDVSLQLSRAGIRLASVLNKSLGSEDADWTTCLGANKQQQQQQKPRTSRHKRRSH